MAVRHRPGGAADLGASGSLSLRLVWERRAGGEIRKRGWRTRASTFFVDGDGWVVERGSDAVKAIHGGNVSYRTINGRIRVHS
jgi:hypothetical protein